MPDFPRSILAFQRQFSDEAACAAWLSRARWPEGFRPGCRHDHAWDLATKAWTYECAKMHTYECAKMHIVRALKNRR